MIRTKYPRKTLHRYRGFKIQFDPDPMAQKYDAQWRLWEGSEEEAHAKETYVASTVNEAKEYIDEILEDRPF